MDVNKASFPSRLLDVLVAISEAHFVAFDLELSGVPVKPHGDRAGKPSLQQRYLETKRAAEQYQILQIGLTCVKEEENRGLYSIKPFNFNLNPVVEERIDIDRNFTFHSGAVEFLLSVGFRMELPFTSGVPYLSHAEAKLAEERAAARQDKASFADIQLKAEDTQSLELLRVVRVAISEWKRTGEPNSNSFVVGPSLIHGEKTTVEELSRFERRLIHQLVRADYPDLVTIPYRGLIRIAKFDQEREDYIKAQRNKDSRERIIRQTGFRWVVDALSGSPVHDIDVKSFAHDPTTGQPIFVHLDDLKAKFYRAQHLLRNKKAVLVGHNMFLDLVYLYKTFIGELPDTVEEFSALIHQLFPTIVDTKYMATHNCGDINPASSLEQIADQLQLQQYPLLGNVPCSVVELGLSLKYANISAEIHADYTKYDGTKAFHEAGYDSMLTAQVAVRLSTKLEGAGSYLLDGSFAENKASGDLVSGPPSPEDEGGGVKLASVSEASNPSRNNGTAPEASTVSSAIDGLRNVLLAPVKALVGKGGHSTRQEIALQEDENDVSGSTAGTQDATSAGKVVATKTSGKKGKKKKKRTTAKSAALQSHAAPTGRFAHATAFDQLQDSTNQDDTDSEEEMLQFDTLPSSTSHLSAPVVADTDGISEPVVSAPIDWDTPHWRREPGKAMPKFDSNFWKVYGNRLRVFGTEEGLCQLL